MYSEVFCPLICVDQVRSSYKFTRAKRPSFRNPRISIRGYVHSSVDPFVGFWMRPRIPIRLSVRRSEKRPPCPYKDDNIGCRTCIHWRRRRVLARGIGVVVERRQSLLEVSGMLLKGSSPSFRTYCISIYFSSTLKKKLRIEHGNPMHKFFILILVRKLKGCIYIDR